MRRTDPLIVGGGPAGAAAAIALAQRGARAMLIERHDTPHDIVCGAFVGWDAIAALEDLGLDPWALGAQPIDRVRILAGDRVIERRLPRRAAGLSRSTLDSALLARASAAGVDVRRGLAARRIEGTTVQLADGSALEAESIFIATGKYALRGSPRENTPKATRVGLRTALPGQPDLAGWIELHLFDGGYVGLLVQDDGRINLCLSVSTARLAGSPEALMAALAAQSPRLAARLGEQCDWAAVAAVPYGWRARDTAPGHFRIGDQAAVIASVVGDGIAIALASGRDAAAAWATSGAAAAPAFQRAFAARARRPILIGELIRAAAERPGLARSLLGLVRAPGAVAMMARLSRIGH